MTKKKRNVMKIKAEETNILCNKMSFGKQDAYLTSTSRMLVVRLDSGSYRTANFQFAENVYLTSRMLILLLQAGCL